MFANSVLINQSEKGNLAITSSLTLDFQVFERIQTRDMTSPFAFTPEELKMMQKDYKKPKAKKWFVSEKKVAVAKNTLHERGTVSTRNKQRMSKEIAEFL